MSPAPKACPIEQQCQILDAAARCIQASSLMDFTMSGVAKQAGMSMGSIYKHIYSKEDVLVALATRTFASLHQTFSEIFELPLTMPERLIAISLLDFQRVDPYPFSRELEMLIGNQALLSRASATWVERMSEMIQRIEQLFIAKLEEATERGELSPQGNTEDYLQQLHLGIWAINVGFIQVALQIQGMQANSDNQASYSLPFPLAEADPHIMNCCRLINSYHWQHPLDSEGISRAARALCALDYR